MNYIDLTMPLTPSTPVYPGDPQVEVTVAGELDKDGYLDHLLKLGTHNGTHIDAPAHMIANGKLLSAFSLDHFVGTGKVVDVREGFSLDALEAADIQQGDIVLLYTGKSEHFDAPDYYTDYPSVTDEAAEFVVTKGAKMVGVDTGSVDHEPFLVHKKLLGNDVLIIENLVNLGQLVGKSFTVFALPLNLTVEGSPARVIAQVN